MNNLYDKYEVKSHIKTEMLWLLLRRKVFGFEQTYMYESLVIGPLGISECAGECHFSANLCKRALYVTAGVIVEVTSNADILTINAIAL